MGSEKKKDTSSTSGMKTSKETSQFMQCRLDDILPKRLPEMREAIKSRNFDKVCEITMKDSNNIHAICRDTYPTITYMNDISLAIVRSVEKINKYFNKTVCAFTFDAGPNGFILLQKENCDLIAYLFTHVFLNEQNDTEINSKYATLIEDLKLTRSVLNHETPITKVTKFRVGSGAQ